MSICFKLLRFPSVDENFSLNLVSLDQLFSSDGIMTRKDTCEPPKIPKNEIAINVESFLDIDSDITDGDRITSCSSKADETTIGCTSKDTPSTSKNIKPCKGHSVQIDTIGNNHDPRYNKQSYSTGVDTSDVICFGATVLIVTLLISILIFYVFKDHETNF